MNAPRIDYAAVSRVLVDEGLTPNPRNPELSIACARKLLEKNAAIETAERDVLLAAERADEQERRAFEAEEALTQVLADNLRLSREVARLRAKAPR